MATLWAQTVTFNSIEIGDRLPVIIKWETAETIERYNGILLSQDPDAPDDAEISETLDPRMLDDYVKESLLKGFPPSSIENPASQIDIKILEEIEAEDILSIEGIVTGKSIEDSISIVDCSVVIERQDKTVVANASARLALDS